MVSDETAPETTASSPRVYAGPPKTVYAGGVTVGMYTSPPTVSEWIEEHGESWESGLDAGLDVNVEFDTDVLILDTLEKTERSEWLMEWKELFDAHGRRFDAEEFFEFVTRYSDEYARCEDSTWVPSEVIATIRQGAKAVRLGVMGTHHAYDAAYRYLQDYAAQDAAATRDNLRAARGYARDYARLVRVGIFEGWWSWLTELSHIAGGYTYNEDTDLSRDITWSVFTDSQDFYGNGFIIADENIYEPAGEITDFLDWRARWSTHDGHFIEVGEVKWVPSAWLATFPETYDYSGYPVESLELRVDGDTAETWSLIWVGDSRWDQKMESRVRKHSTVEDARGPNFYVPWC